MALWQVDFFIIPQQSIATIEEGKQMSLSEEYDFPVESFWINKNIKSSLFDAISTFLPLGKSWSENIVLYGDEKSTRVDVSSDEFVYCVSVRIDFTTDYKPIVEKLLHFILKNDLIFIYKDFNAICSDLEAIENIVNNSRNRKNYGNLIGDNIKSSYFNQT